MISLMLPFIMATPIDWPENPIAKAGLPGYNIWSWDNIFFKKIYYYIKKWCMISLNNLYGIGKVIIKTFLFGCQKSEKLKGIYFLFEKSTDWSVKSWKKLVSLLVILWKNSGPITLPRKLFLGLEKAAKIDLKYLKMRWLDEFKTVE